MKPHSLKWYLPLCLTGAILLACASVGFPQQMVTVFSDDFDGNGNEWHFESTDASSGAKFQGGTMRLEGVDQGYCSIVEKYVNISADKNFRIETLASKENGIQNNAYGLVWGMKSKSDFFQFCISGDGHYQVAQMKNAQYENVVPWTKSPDIRQGNAATNLLAIEKQGQALKFYINGVLQVEKPFMPFTGHKLGFRICDKQVASFDYLKVMVERTPDLNLSGEGWGNKPFFVEEFDGNQKGWPLVQSAAGEGSDFFMRLGRYYFTHKRDHHSWLAYQSTSLDDTQNFILETSLRKESGVNDNGYGLIFGRRDNVNQHEFLITGDGFFKILQRVDNTVEELQSWTPSAAVNQGVGAENNLKVLKVNRKMRFYINDVFVHQLDFNGFSGDLIGFVIYKNQGISIEELKVSYLEAAQENSPPSITITQPKVDTRAFFKVISTRQVQVAGKVEDADGVASVSVNDVAAQVLADGTFSATVPLTLGENELHVKAIDRKQKAGYETFTIIRKDPTESAEKRLALVIGNGDYQQAGKLQNPVNDARAIKEKLEKVGFEVIIRENCTQVEAKKAIDAFGQQLNGYQTGLLFYAGHGLQVGGVNYMVPIDAHLSNENDVEYECVMVDRVLAKMESAGSTTNIVILDACRDNPFESGWARSTKGGGLAFMNAPRGSLIAYATSPGNVASDGSGEHGLYTEALLKMVDKPDVNILEMFQQVRGLVVEQSNGKQIPWESTSLTGNNFYMVQNGNGGVRVPEGGFVSSGKEIINNRRGDEPRPKVPEDQKFSYIIKTYTPPKQVMLYANTNEMVKITLYGDKDNYQAILNDPDKNDFEYGNWDEFRVDIGKDLGNLVRIEMEISESDGDLSGLNGWYLQTLQIEDLTRKKEFTIQVNAWLDDEVGGLKLDRVVK